MNYFASQEILRPNAGAKRIKESLCLFLQIIHGLITHDKDCFSSYNETQGKKKS